MAEEKEILKLTARTLDDSDFKRKELNSILTRKKNATTDREAENTLYGFLV